MPVTQSLEFSYTTGQTLTAQLFADKSDTVVATAVSVTEATNRKGIYVATFTDVPAGDYLMVYFLAGSGAGSEFYRLTLSISTFTPAIGNMPTAAENATATREELAAELAKIATIETNTTLAKQVRIT